MLQITDAHLKRGDLELFDGLSCTIHAGQKVGVVGRNGAGKSTLFQLILGRLGLESGDLTLPRDWRIAHLAQEVEATDRPAIDYVIDGHRVIRQLETRIAAAEAAGDDQVLASLHGRYDDLGGYGIQVEAQRVLSGLGFSSDEFQQPFSSFSGGWRIRLALARALLQPSELLLLDEPTNHLDMETSLWLEQWLQRYRGTVLIIAHDRAFLDATTDYILHLQGGRASLYRGGYSAFENQYAEQLSQASAARQKQSAERAHIEQFVRRFRAKASKAKQVQSRLKALERMADLAPVYADSPYHVAFPEPADLPSPLLAIRDLALGYDGQRILTGITESILPGDRIGVLGQNGAGKSTLLKALVGDLAPLAGEITQGRGLNCGYFAQHQLETLDPAVSPLASCQARTTARTEQQCRNYLGTWGFGGPMVERPIRTLSGGEKSRLVLALMATAEPNLLILDEPTNHLDLDMREALVLALQQYAGALIIVSHDRALLERTIDRFWLVADGGVVHHPGDLDDYRAALRTQDTAITATTPGNRKSKRQQAAAARAARAPLKRRVQQLEAEVNQHSQALAEIESRLADPALYHGLPADELDALMRQAGQLRQQLEAAELAWLEAAGELEAADEAAGSDI